MEESNKFQMLFKYGLRESKILDEIDCYKDNGIVESRTEALRRALHSFRYLVKSDENELVTLLYAYLIDLKYSLNPDFDKATSLSLAAYAAMIAKRGILAAEPFSTIPATLEIIKNMKLSNQESGPVLDEVIASIKTVFIKDTEPPASEKVINIPTTKSFFNEITIQLSPDEKEKSHKGLWPLIATGLNAVQVNSKGKGMPLFEKN